MFGEEIGTGPLGFLGNIVWFVLAGWWLALGHLFAAIALAFTIIGLPFAWAHLKLAGFALWPIGRTLVRSDLGRRVYQDAPLLKGRHLTKSFAPSLPVISTAASFPKF
ncbi:MAG: YccF domain-containing protein [Parvularculaceae bacterium]